MDRGGGGGACPPTGLQVTRSGFKALRWGPGSAVRWVSYQGPLVRPGWRRVGGGLSPVGLVWGHWIGVVGGGGGGSAPFPSVFLSPKACKISTGRNRGARGTYETKRKGGNTGCGAVGRGQRARGRGSGEGAG